MNADNYRKVLLLQEVAKQNRIIELRLKMQKCKNEQIRRQFEKMIENLSSKK